METQDTMYQQSYPSAILTASAMHRTLPYFIMIMMSFIVQISAQKTLAFTPQLIEGQQIEYKSQVDMKLYINNTESDLISLFANSGNKPMMTTTSLLQVSKVFDDGYEITISSKDMATSISLMQNMMDSSLLKSFPSVIVTTDKQLKYKKLVNWQEIQKAYKAMLMPVFDAYINNMRKMIPAKAHKDSLAKFEQMIKEMRVQFSQKADSMFSTQEQIEAMVQDSYMPYFEAYSYNYGIGKDNVQVGLVKTSKSRIQTFSQDFLQATVYNRLVKREGALSKCYTKIVYDEAALKDMTLKKGKTANIVKCTEIKNYTFNSKSQLLTNVDHDIVFEMDEMKLVSKVKSTAKLMN